MAIIFNTGDQGSQSTWVAALQSLIDQGQASLDSIEGFRVNQLIVFNNKLSAVNARRNRSSKVIPANVAVLFGVSDFTTIDESQTTTTVRVDSQTATIKERSIPADLFATNVTFSSNSGAVETLSTSDNQYRVNSPSIPTGTFDVTLNSSFNVNVIVFDILAQASINTITVSLSEDGIVYTPAYKVAINGYRVTAWFNSVAGNKLRIAILPSIADTVGGTQYSFGFSGLASRATSFNLRSDLVSLPVSFNPISIQGQLNADIDPNIIYYLQMSTSSITGTFVQIVPGTSFSIPGAAEHNLTGQVFNGTSGNFTALPTNLVPSTVTVIETTGGISKHIPVIRGLSYSSAYTGLQGEYIGLNSNILTIVNASKTLDTSRTFNINYLASDPVTVTLKVRLSTSDKGITPFFRGATLEEI